MIIKLPVSGLNVEIRDSISYGQSKKLDRFIQDKAGARVGKDGLKDFDLEVTAISEYTELAFAAFIASIKKDDGTDIPVTKDFIDSLDAEDGAELEDVISRKTKSLKKKQKITDAESNLLLEQAQGMES